MAGLVVALAWVAGAALGIRSPAPWWAAVGLASAGLGVAALSRSGPVRLVALALAAALLGVARGGSVGASPATLGPLGPATVVGRVADAPLPQGGRLTFPVDVVAVERPGHESDAVEPPGAARVLVRAARADVEIGDLIAIRGRLVVPRSRPGWPEAEILARRGIGTIVDAAHVAVREPAGPSLLGAFHRLRRDLDGTIKAALPEPHASLVSGIALGARGGLPAELRQALSATGTSHVVAASGFNVTVVGGVAMVVAVRLVGRPWALAPTMLVIWAYALLVGGAPAIVRAAWMATFGIGALALGRLADAATALALSAALMVAWDPSLVYDLSFQLSAMATAGLVLFGAPLATLFWPLPNAVREPLGTTLAAQLATLPILLATFHSLSLVAPLANLAVAPAIPALTVLGGILSLVGTLPGVGTIVGGACWALAAYLLAAIQTLGQWPGAHLFTGQLPSWLAAAWYLALALLALARSPELSARFGDLRRVRLAALAAPLALTVTSPLLAGPPSGALTVSMLDVGAPAIFVRAPGGRTLLVTADAVAGQLAASLGQRLTLWERGPDVAVATRTDVRTRVALDDVLRRYPAALVVVPPANAAEGVPPADDVAGALPADASNPTGDVSRTALVADEGTRVELEPGVWLHVVAVRNDDGLPSLDVALSAPAVTIWLPASGEPDRRWRDLPADRATVVRLPGRSARWLEAVGTHAVALVGDGIEATPGAVSAGVALFDHRRHGAVEIEIDDDGVSLVAERCPADDGCRLVIPFGRE